MEGEIKDVNAENMSEASKFATTRLNYPSLKWVPIDIVDTHSLISEGANALSFAEYRDRHIQKMGRWRGETFK